MSRHPLLYNDMVRGRACASDDDVLMTYKFVGSPLPTLRSIRLTTFTVLPSSITVTLSKSYLPKHNHPSFTNYHPSSASFITVEALLDLDIYQTFNNPIRESTTNKRERSRRHKLIRRFSQWGVISNKPAWKQDLN